MLVPYVLLGVLETERGGRVNGWLRGYHTLLAIGDANRRHVGCGIELLLFADDHLLEVVIAGACADSAKVVRQDDRVLRQPLVSHHRRGLISWSHAVSGCLRGQILV